MVTYWPEGKKCSVFSKRPVALLSPFKDRRETLLIQFLELLAMNLLITQLKVFPLFNIWFLTLYVACHSLPMNTEEPRGSEILAASWASGKEDVYSLQTI